MCIIAIKPKGKKMFDDNTIKTMYINNPDGAGYMYHDGKCVRIVKGFMTCGELLEDLHSKDFTGTNLIMHFRIGTSGRNDALNCHPYPIYQKNAVRCKTDLGIAHNGVLRGYIPPKYAEYNDTQMFIRCVLSNLKPDFLEDSDKIMLIEELIGTNKFAFLNDKNKVYTIGDFVKSDGYMFSNRSFEPKSLYPRETTYSRAYSKVSKKDNDFWNDEPNDFWDDWDRRHPTR